MKIRLKNGSLIQIVGSDNIDSVVGTNPIGCVFSEYSLQNPAGWDFVRPILTENDGWAIFNYTPRGHNHGYDLYNTAKKNEKWFCEVLTVQDTKAISLQSIEDERQAGMGEDLIEQEFYCSFDAAVPGAYYAIELRKARDEGRICKVPHEDYSRVHTAWDLGMDDSTTIWFFQIVGREIHMIDYYEKNGQGLKHYAEVLRDKKYLYGTHIAPHDIEVRELGTGTTRKATAADLGIDFTVAPRMLVEDGINSVRALLSRCWFDEVRCSHGINALSSYRHDYDEKNRAFRTTPVHDWSCLVGTTKVLTRYGICQIMDLPKTGEVKTLCGWKQYVNPKITKKNAQLVEVVFNGGFTVQCTPDHRFLTESGWKYAEDLKMGSSIRSGLTLLPNILMDLYGGFTQAKDTFLKGAKNCIDAFGKPLSGISPMDAISTIGMATSLTTPCRTLRAFLFQNTFQKTGKTNVQTGNSILPITQEVRPQNGTSQKQEGFGTVGMPRSQRVGQNGSANHCRANIVGKLLTCLSEKAVILKNIVLKHVRPLRIESVNKISEKQDVWCLTVPAVGHFCLENGAVVHNSHGADGFRMLAIGLDLVADPRSEMIDQYARENFIRSLDADF